MHTERGPMLAAPILKNSPSHIGQFEGLRKGARSPGLRSPGARDLLQNGSKGKGTQSGEKDSSSKKVVVQLSPSTEREDGTTEQFERIEDLCKRAAAGQPTLSTFNSKKSVQAPPRVQINLAKAGQAKKNEPQTARPGTALRQPFGRKPEQPRIASRRGSSRN